MPDAVNRVSPGESLILPCIAAGSALPFMKWKKLDKELLPNEDVGRMDLHLYDIRSSNSYTCVAERHG